MDDSKIIELFYERSEQAIIELSNKYDKLCKKIANNILNNSLDIEECVNDAYLGLWNTIPPQNPNPLVAYVCKVVRNLAIKKYHNNTAIKRNSAYDISLDELENCFGALQTVEDDYNLKLLSEEIDNFLDGLDEENRSLILDLLETIASTGTTTLLHVTHEQDEVLSCEKNIIELFLLSSTH